MPPKYDRMMLIVSSLGLAFTSIAMTYFFSRGDILIGVWLAGCATITAGALTSRYLTRRRARRSG